MRLEKVSGGCFALMTLSTKSNFQTAISAVDGTAQGTHRCGCGSRSTMGIQTGQQQILSQFGLTLVILIA
jgi:hypothetical protein